MTEKYFIYPFADQGDRETVPDDQVNTLVNYQFGYTPEYELNPDTDPDGNFVGRQRFNQVLYDISAHAKQIQDKGYPSFVADKGDGSPLSYQKDRIVELSGDYYRSLVGGTTTTPPSAEWEGPLDQLTPKKADTPTAQAGTNDTDYMTPLKTKQQLAVFGNDFKKSLSWEPAFTASGGQLKTNSDIVVRVDNDLLTFSANEAISTPTLMVGVDYAIYATHDGLLVSSNFTVPDGYTESNSRRIGGFHYGDGEFKTHSFYDLHFRPRARDPRGMVLDLGERFWADIYLTNTTPGLLGTSAYDAQIADGGSAPKVPAMLGGDGTQQYSDYTQFTANELLACYGKRLPNYQEFQMLARGSESGYVRGSDPVKTLFDGKSRSIIGCEQVSGHMWQWGSEVWDRGNGTSGYEWYDITGGYGKMRASHPQGVGASFFGGNWDDSGNAGSRASYWDNEPSGSDTTISSRGLCDHVLLV